MRDRKITSEENVQCVDPFNGYKFVYETNKIGEKERRRRMILSGHRMLESSAQFNGFGILYRTYAKKDCLSNFPTYPTRTSFGLSDLFSI